MLELALRAIVSLAFVVGLLWAIARVTSRKMHGSTHSLVHVVTRQQLGRGSSLAVVNVGDRTLVVGMTEHEVRLLAELDPAELPVSEPAAPTSRTLRSASSPAVTRSGGSRAAARPGLRPVLRAVQGMPTHVPRHARTAPAAPAAPAASREKHLPVATSTPLGGSVLSGQTWKQAFEAATGRVGSAS